LSLAKGADNQGFMRLIDEEFLKHPFYGSRKMTVYLNRKGIAVNRKRVHFNMTWCDHVKDGSYQGERLGVINS
jgi:hypothetical protein